MENEPQVLIPMWDYNELKELREIMNGNRRVILNRQYNFSRIFGHSFVWNIITEEDAIIELGKRLENRENEEMKLRDENRKLTRENAELKKRWW